MREDIMREATQTKGEKPNLYLVSPVDRELIEGFSATPRTPYQVGYETCRYQRVYANPYPSGSTAWWQCEAGHADARVARRVRL